MREDSRFVVDNNKIFKPLKKEKFKVQLDDRFKGVLSDEKFHSNRDVKGNKKGKGKNDMKELYSADVSSSNIGKKDVSSSKTNEDRLAYLTKMARGEISGDSSDESEDDVEEAAEDSDDEEEDDPAVGGEDEPHRPLLQIPGDEDIPTGDATSRIAILNFDWQNLKAIDLMMVLQSFCPAGTAIRSVTIYPSDFGLKAMEVENRLGPQGIWEAAEGAVDAESTEELYDAIATVTEAGDRATMEGEFQRGQDKTSVGIVFHDELCKRGLSVPDEDEDTEQTRDKAANDGFNNEALRVYELTKLKYYFAIVECDSVATASILYERMDGLEFEHSAMSFDLRFVPDDTRYCEAAILLLSLRSGICWM